MKDVQDILTHLSTLSPEELAAVQTAAKALRGQSEDSSSSADTAVLEVWPLFVEEMAKRGVKLPPTGIISRHRLYPKIVEGCVHLLEVVEMFNPANKLERIGAARICVEALLLWIERIGLPPTVRTFAQQMVNMGVALDDQFPHYRAANLLHVLIRGNHPSAR